MIFKVRVGAGVPAHWPLLKRRLEAICPNLHGETHLWRFAGRGQAPQHPFLLQVTSYDRRGFLHGAPPPLTLSEPCTTPSCCRSPPVTAAASSMVRSSAHSAPRRPPCEPLLGHKQDITVHACSASCPLSVLKQKSCEHALA